MTNVDQISCVLESKLYRFKLKHNFSQIVFLCIGSNKIIGDCFGPLVGNFLSKNIWSKDIDVLGTIDNPITYNNYFKVSNEIKKKYINPCIISIDAALGKRNCVGEIYVGWGKIEMGKAIHKTLICESNINIKGVVAENSNKMDNLYKLEQVKEKDIFNLSFKTSEGIIKSLYKFY